MVKTLSILLIISSLAVSCEKGTEYSIPGNYPTTFNKLSSSTISQMRTTYALKNQYTTSSLNGFGFCGWFGDPLNVATPPLQNSITQSEAIEIVKTFASRNTSETGIQNPNDLTFHEISASTGFGGATGWHFKTTTQKADTIEVMYSIIIVHISNREVNMCVGNWYPDIFIPERFNVSQARAKDDLVGVVVSHYTFGGEEYFVTISKTDLANSTIRLKVLPIENEDKIELRVCWQINIPGPVYYLMYVDVMTGKIVGQEPTIIS
jgi:hypothetical protein